jgi:predicted acylesterase/phospholipase RssA
VLKGLEEDGVEVVGIAGTSMGAIIGALKAQGFSAADMEELFTRIDWFELGRVLLGSVIGPAFREMLQEVLGETVIESLRLPFAAVCCDLDNGQEVVLREGDLATAVCASSSIPGVLPPVRLGGRTLVDGAIVKPVPVEAARMLGEASLLAVNVLRLAERVPAVTTAIEVPTVQGQQPRTAVLLQRWVESKLGQVEEVLTEIPDRWEVTMRSFEIMEDRLARPMCQQIEMIEPEVGRFGWFDFPRYAEIVAEGYRAYRLFTESTSHTVEESPQW